jgi:hypothetical protein
MAMKVFWTIVKVVLGLAILVPVSIIVLSIALGALGALVGLAFAVLRLAVLGLLAWGVFKVGSLLFGGRRTTSPPEKLKELPPVDPYYEAAKRELDQHIGDSGR